MPTTQTVLSNRLLAEKGEDGIRIKDVYSNYSTTFDPRSVQALEYLSKHGTVSGSDLKRALQLESNQELHGLVKGLVNSDLVGYAGPIHSVDEIGSTHIYIVPSAKALAERIIRLAV